MTVFSNRVGNELDLSLPKASCGILYLLLSASFLVFFLVYIYCLILLCFCCIFLTLCVNDCAESSSDSVEGIETFSYI